jgi:excisionase family DNA binding protein
MNGRLTGTPAEVADALGCDVETVRSLIADGRIPHLKLSARKTVVPWAALEDWLAAESRASLKVPLVEVLEEGP